MKRNLFFIVLLAVSSSLFAQVPQSFYMRGTALAESSEPMQMKRINKDFPESYNGNMVISNTYELITALKTGEYEFASDASGAAWISPQSITVNDGDEELVPYRIRVNFDEGDPVVIISEVDAVTMWAPWNGYEIAELDYTGNSSFENNDILYNKALWGDERYRIKLYTVDGDLTTYAYIQGNQTAPDDDNNSDGYFDLYTTADTGWAYEDENGEKYNATEFKLSKKRRGEGFPLEPFNIRVIFQVNENYTHVISDQKDGPDPGPGDSSVKENNNSGIQVYPGTIENSVTIITNEDNFTADFISMTGKSVLKANSTGKTLLLDNISIDKGMYILKITAAGKVLGIQRVIKL